nr:phosphatase PAP2 family protein [uncultured Sphingomonas sp.]
MSERWILFSYSITAIWFALSLIIFDHVGMANAPDILALKYWLSTFLIFILVAGGLVVTKMALQRAQNPIGAILSERPNDKLVSVLLGWFIVSASLTTFGFIKPQLGALGFHADTLLAAIDNRILGTNGWQLMEWSRHRWMGGAYHAVWLIWIGLIVSVFLWQKAGPKKDMALISYFLLWTIGPIIHLLLPAAGPALHHALTLDPQFADLRIAASDQKKFDYLLNGFLNREFNPAGGISAMPSLHIATMVWTIIVTRGAWRIVAIILTLYMWVASVALGWHYMVDGLVGALVAIWAVLIARAITRLFTVRGGERLVPAVAKAPVPGATPPPSTPDR